MEHLTLPSQRSFFQRWLMKLCIVVMSFLPFARVEAQPISCPDGMWPTTSVLHIKKVEVYKDTPGYRYDTKVRFTWYDTCGSKWEIQVLRLFNTDPYKLGKDTIQAKVDWSRAISYMPYYIETEVDTVDTVRRQTCRLTLTEGTGYYVWRVRRIYSTQYIQDTSAVGKWTDVGPFNDGAIVDIPFDWHSEDSRDFCFFYNQFDDSLNWIYRRSIGTGSLLTEKIDYANYLLQPLQNQVGNSTLNETVVSQTVLDNLGRPVMNSLPAPFTDEGGWLGYRYGSFLNNSSNTYREDDFDYAGNFQNPSKVKGPINNYYSPSNSDVTVPIAQNRPYTRTVYYNDGLNRPREIASPGDQLSFLSDHTVKMYYGKPTTTELIRLFGDEAPASESVNKTWTKDPNGVMSITYTDEAGRTIATCLTTPKSGLLDHLSDDTFMDYDTITKKIEISPTQFISKATYTFAVPTQLDYFYKIVPKYYGDKCLDLCATCDYQIHITAKERDDTPTYHAYLNVQPVFDSVKGRCNSFTVDTTDTYAVPMGNTVLDPGTYDVTLFLQLRNINPSTGRPYIDDYVDVLHRRIDNAFSAGGKVLPSGFVKSLTTMQTYLDAGDINGLLDYLDVDTSQPTFKMVFNNDCDTLELPTVRCKKPDCGTPKYAEYMKQTLQSWDHDNDTDYFEPVYTGNIGKTTDTSNFFLLTSDAQFNTIISNMISDGYNCDTLWNAWVSTVNTYIAGQLAIDSCIKLHDTTLKYDWWALFMQKVGYKAAIEIKPYADIYNSSSLVRTKPYKYFPYDWGTYGNLEDVYCYMASGAYPCVSPYNGTPPGWYSSINNFPTDPAADPFHIFNFCMGVKGKGIPVSGGTSYSTQFINMASAGTTSFNLAIASGTPAMTRQQLQYQCNALCDEKLDALVDEVKDKFMANNIKVENYAYDAWRTAATDSVPFQKVFCLAYSAVEYCKSQCDFFPDSSGTLSSTKLARIRNAVSSTMNLNVDPGSTECPEGYETVPVVGSNNRQALVNWLNRQYQQQKTIMQNNGLLTVSSWNPFTTSSSVVTSPLSTSTTANLTLQHSDAAAYFSVGVVGTSQSSCPHFNFCRTAPDSVYYDDKFYVRAFAASLPTLAPGDSVVFVENIPTGFTVLNYWGNLVSGGTQIRYTVFGPKNVGDTAEMFYQLQAPSVNSSVNLSGTTTIYRGGVVYSTCSLNRNIVTTNCIGLYFTRYLECLAGCDYTRTCVYGGLCKDEGGCEGSICVKWERFEVDDTTRVIRPKTCGVLTCQNFQDRLTKQIEDVHYKHEQLMRDEYAYMCVNKYNIEDQWVNYFEQTMYQYTLYYYDRAGNLVRTVPPKGVNLTTTSRSVNPPHTMATEYDYNTAGQVVRQKTPDGGQTRYFYDLMGHLRFSQSALQMPYNKYSYTKYDDLNRVVETGEMQYNAYSDIDVVYINDPTYPSSVGGTVLKMAYTTRTTYTTKYGSGLAQNYVNNKISFVQTDRDGDFTTTGDQVETIFSYDFDGRIEREYQGIPGLSARRMVSYGYDWVTGKPTVMGLFNDNASADADYFRNDYEYDDDGRLKHIGDLTANLYYSYARHQPGWLQTRTQGGLDIDYVYTLSGWLKGTKSNAYKSVLHYFPNDFQHAGSPYYTPTAGLLTGYDSLYNGTIAAWQEQIGTPSPPSSGKKYESLVYKLYRYDELYRLTQNGFTASGTLQSIPSNNPYSEYLAYDKNGNIEHVLRTAEHPSTNAPMVIDSMTYHYAANTNRLTSLSDGATPVSGYEHAVSSSYTYDNSGNLKEDNGSGLKDIGYNPYGKIDSLKNNNTGNTVYFLYDGLGRRVKKTTGSDEEYYVYDAGDKLIAVYPNGTVSSISQRFIYGLNGSQEMVMDGANVSGTGFLYFNGKYLLNDHLGNVRALHNGSSTPAISAYNNYYAFGSLQPDRYYNTLNSKLGFNGQARDDDFNGVGNFNTAKFWEYDTRIGRRWEMDPKPQTSMSDYAVFKNNPISNTDIWGDEVKTSTETAKNEVEKYGEKTTINARGKEKSNNNYEGAFGKLYKEWKDDDTKVVTFSTGSGNGTIGYNGKNEKGQDEFTIFWDPTQTTALGASGLFEETYHLKEAIDGVEMKFAKNTGDISTGYGVAGLDIYDEVRAKLWVIDNIKAVNDKYEVQSGQLGFTHYGYIKSLKKDTKTIADKLMFGTKPMEATPKPIFNPGSTTIGGSQINVNYTPVNFGGQGYRNMSPVERKPNNNE